MQEYDFINLYLHILYSPSCTILQNLFEDENEFFAFVKWNNEKQINIPRLKEINHEKLLLLKKVKTIDQINHILGEDWIKKLDDWKNKIKSKQQIIFLAGIENHDRLNRLFIDEEKLKKYQSNDMNILCLHQFYGKDDLSFKNPHNYFLKALYQIDQWPALLVCKPERCVVIPIHQIKELDQYFDMIESQEIYEQLKKDDHKYIVHLSDLHFGSRKHDPYVENLFDSLNKLKNDVNSNQNLHFLITGDLMNSPTRKNMYAASHFMNQLKKEFNSNVNFVLGNHDVIVRGLNLFKRQKAKVIAYLLGRNVYVSEKDKIIYIELNSTVEGNLARGKVGKDQLKEMDDELATIDNIEEYTLIAILHHHILPIPKDVFLRQKWSEKHFIGRWIDRSKALVDSKEVLKWLKKHHIQYVFHGHKHLPFFNYETGMYIIAAGSSCGSSGKEKKSSYLSYNIVKYDRLAQTMKYCMIRYDDISQMNRRRVKIHLFQGGFYEVSRQNERQ